MSRWVGPQKREVESAQHDLGESATAAVENQGGGELIIDGVEKKVKFPALKRKWKKKTKKTNKSRCVQLWKCIHYLARTYVYLFPHGSFLRFLYLVYIRSIWDTGDFCFEKSNWRCNIITSIYQLLNENFQNI